MKEDREKELKRLIYLRSELIKECKKDIKKYHQEIEQINGEKRLMKEREKDYEKNSIHNRWYRNNNDMYRSTYTMYRRT